MLKEKYSALVAVLSVDEEMLEFVSERMAHLCNYVDRVVQMEYSIPLLRARYEGQDLIDKIENLDRARRSAHELAIAAVRQLNRLCVAEGVEKLFSGDESDRYQIADFCGLVVNELFEGRTR